MCSLGGTAGRSCEWLASSTAAGRGAGGSVKQVPIRACAQYIRRHIPSQSRKMTRFTPSFGAQPPAPAPAPELVPVPVPAGVSLVTAAAPSTTVPLPWPTDRAKQCTVNVHHPYSYSYVLPTHTVHVLLIRLQLMCYPPIRLQLCVLPTDVLPTHTAAATGTTHPYGYSYMCYPQLHVLPTHTAIADQA